MLIMSRSLGLCPSSLMSALYGAVYMTKER